MFINDFEQKIVFNDFKTSKKTKPQTVLIEEETKTSVARRPQQICIQKTRVFVNAQRKTSR